MISEKERLNQEDTLDTGMLLDAVTSLIDAFKQARFDTPAGHRKHYQAFHGR